MNYTTIVNDIENLIKEESISTIFLNMNGVVLESVEAMCQLLNNKYRTTVKSVDI